MGLFILIGLSVKILKSLKDSFSASSHANKKLGVVVIDLEFKLSLDVDHIIKKTSTVCSPLCAKTKPLC